MIIPVKKVSLITMTDNESFMLEGLGKLGVVQLQKLDEAEFIGFEKRVIEDQREYENLKERFQLLYGKLGRAVSLQVGRTGIDKKIIPEKELTVKLEELEKKATDIESELREKEEYLKEINEIKPTLQILKDQGINPQDLGDFQNLFVKAGTASSKFLPRLERIVQGRKDVTYKSSAISENKDFLYLSGLLDVKPWIEKSLKAVGFDEIHLPQSVPDKIDDAIKWSEKESEYTQNQIQELKGKWKDLEQDFIKISGNLEESINYHLSLSSAKSNSLRSKMMSAFQGWIPEDKISELDSFLGEVKQKDHERIIVWYEDPAHEEEIPTIMKNPKLFKAYEVLTRQYGYPDAREMDPTPISTVLWIVMFGIMFPDSGQGLVIIGMGVLFGYIMKKNMMGMNVAKIGKLMIGLGISTTIFGLLSDEFFLTEVQPLWPGLKPGWIMEPANVIWMIKIAIFFGITQIMIGIIISIFNHLRTGEYHDALLGEHGVAGLMTFGGIVLVIFQFLGLSIVPGIRFPKLGLGILTHWTIIIPIAGILVIFIKPILLKEGATMGLGVLIETLISFIGNILSYSRIAGFAIAHAALALVVVELLHANPALGIGLGLIFLNIFALTLEFLVCMIQALRLLYYEFSTKFFKGTGTPYSPFKL